MPLQQLSASAAVSQQSANASSCIYAILPSVNCHLSKPTPCIKHCTTQRLSPHHPWLACNRECSAWPLLNVNSIAQRLHLEPGVQLTLLNFMIANQVINSEGFYQLLITASPKSTITYKDMLQRRVVCPPFSVTQANLHSLPRLATAPGTQQANLLDRYCYGSAGGPDGTPATALVQPSCVDAHMNMRDFAGAVALTSSNLGGGGSGGYDLMYINQLYVCEHQVWCLFSSWA